MNFIYCDILRRRNRYIKNLDLNGKQIKNETYLREHNIIK